MTPSFMLAFFKYYFPSIVNMSETTICTVYRIYLYLIYVKEASNLQEEQPRIFEENKFFNLIAFLNLQQFVVPKKKKLKQCFSLMVFLNLVLVRKKRSYSCFSLIVFLNIFKQGFSIVVFLNIALAKKNNKKSQLKQGFSMMVFLNPVQFVLGKKKS